ncbi:helix-turn-helix transcriptional regulator [Acidovorax carolinensis]|nr:helix-turn-helix transcriptional regulator [Acidovorax carolinensis]
MNHLTRNAYAAALQLLAFIEAQSDDVEGFARAAVVALNRYVASELTTLSVCDLRTSRCQVVGLPSDCMGAEESVCFDRHFFEHPLVRLYALNGGRFTQRMSDAVSRVDFQCSAPYADCCRRIGLEHAIAVPLCHGGDSLVGFVLHRHRFDFSERDRERLELLRPHLVFLYGHACRAAVQVAGAAPAPPPVFLLPDPAPSELTTRERDVLQWLACGKTDADIAALLSISPRTVQKHLEHIYVKLGVETRTAAVMRFLALREPRAVTAA